MVCEWRYRAHRKTEKQKNRQTDKFFFLLFRDQRRLKRRENQKKVGVEKNFFLQDRNTSAICSSRSNIKNEQQFFSIIVRVFSEFRQSLHVIET
jgi:hypothetical protein